MTIPLTHAISAITRMAVVTFTFTRSDMLCAPDIIHYPLTGNSTGFVFTIPGGIVSETIDVLLAVEYIVCILTIPLYAEFIDERMVNNHEAFS